MNDETRVEPPGPGRGTHAKYVYSFVVWPDETWNFDRAVYDYFRVFRRRTEMHFTKDEFERFCSGMGHHGLTLRDAESQTGTEAVRQPERRR